MQQGGVQAWQSELAHLHARLPQLEAAARLADPTSIGILADARGDLNRAKQRIEWLEISLMRARDER